MEPCLLGVVTRNPMLAGQMVQDLSDIHRKNKLKTLQISVLRVEDNGHTEKQTYKASC